MKDNICHPRPPPKNLFEATISIGIKDKIRVLQFEHRPVGKLVQQSLGETVQFGSSKPTQSP